MLASPTNIAFKLGAQLSGANVVMSSQSSMASSNANQEILPSKGGATLGYTEVAAHQLPMHHLFPLRCPTQWASQSYVPVVIPGLVKSVLPTTLRYRSFWVCPGDLRIMLSTKAAHATPRKALDRDTLVSDVSGKSHTSNCQRSWDLDDAVIAIWVSSFSTATEPSHWLRLDH